MDNEKDYLQLVLDNFLQLTHKPEIFLNSEAGIPESIKSSLKQFYDFSKSEEKKENHSKGLPKLLVQGFDIEQIWQEIELQNSSFLSKSLHNVPKLIVNRDKLAFPNLTNGDTDDQEEIDGEENSDDKDKIIDDDDSGNMSESDELLENEDNDEDDNENNKEMDIDDEFEHEVQENYVSKRKSIVDDEFFKLDEMENFLNTEEKKEQNEDLKKSTKEDEESDSAEENSIDFFEEESEEENDRTRTAKFRDFFRANAETLDKKPKRNKFLEMNEGEEESQQLKSTLELRQERLQKKIVEIEENAVSAKPWTLKGEILADDRPQNSLLEEILEFDMTSRPAPVITENTSLQLEDIIKQRIKDKAFDSVVRKEKPVETPLEYKKKLTLDQEKSKHSLAQIYEKEYLNQQASLDPANADKEEEEPELHKEIKMMMRDLFNKLDALSNFHFTPKPAIPELRIINNLPAITMEEVAPVTTNEASLLAPEEIKNKQKGNILGASEKTKTDKNRERRKKKLKQKKHKLIIEKKNQPGGKNKTKKSDLSVLKNKNTHKMIESNNKSIKSSKAFFTQLQEQAQAHINKKVQNSGKKRDKNKSDARKIKL